MTIQPVPIIAAYAEIAAASDAVVVEGVGGFRVPLSDEFDSADLAAQLNLPVVLVVGLRLGCISHSLLTIEAIVARNLVLAGWVANEIDPDMQFADENIEALRSASRRRCWAACPSWTTRRPPRPPNLSNSPGCLDGRPRKTEPNLVEGIKPS